MHRLRASTSMLKNGLAQQDSAQSRVLQLTIPVLTALLARRVLNKNLQRDVAFFLPFWLFCYLVWPSSFGANDSNSKGRAGNKGASKLSTQIDALKASLKRRDRHHKAEVERLKALLVGKDEQLRIALAKQAEEITRKVHSEIEEAKAAFFFAKEARCSPTHTPVKETLGSNFLSDFVKRSPPTSSLLHPQLHRLPFHLQLTGGFHLIGSPSILASNQAG